MAKRKSTSGAAEPTNRQAEQRIRLVVADGSALDRAGLAALFERQPDIEVVNQAGTIEEAIEACAVNSPDILLLSLTLPGSVHDEALPAIFAVHPSLRVVALSGHSRTQCLVLNPPFPVNSGSLAVATSTAHGTHLCSHGTTCLRVAAERGARATVRRDSDFDTLLQAIRLAHAGQTCHAPDESNGHHAHTGTAQPLSERERTVAGHISHGLSNKEIANALEISEATVKKHVGRVLAKLGLQDRLQVGLYLARNPLALSLRPGNGAVDSFAGN